MKNLLISTYKEAIIYSLGNLANRIIGFILLPLYTAYLTVEDYGVLGLIEPISQVLVTVLVLGLNSAFLRWYSIETEGHRKQTIFFNINFILIINTFLIVLILTGISDGIAIFLFDTADSSLILKLSFLNVFFLVVNPIIFSLFRIEKKSGRFVIIQLIQFSINLLLNIIFIVHLQYGLLSIFMGQLISNALVFIYFTPLFFKYSKFEFDFKLIKEFLLFGLPLIFVGISQLVINLVNRYFLDIYDSLAVVGIFTFAFKITNTIKVIVTESITLSLSPVLYSKLSSADGYRFVKKNYIYTILILMVLYIFVSSFGREMIYLISQSEQYYDAYLYFPALAFLNVLAAMIYFHHILLIYKKKTLAVLYATILTALISLMLNILLIPVLTAHGAAFSIILSNIILFLLLKYFSQKEYGKFYDDRKSLIIIVLGLGLTIVNFFYFNDLSFVNFFIKLLICSFYPFILYSFNIFDPVELHNIKEQIQRILIQRK